MKAFLISILILGWITAGCCEPIARKAVAEGSTPVKVEVKENPLLVEFDTPFGVPPFEKIQNEHYMPAFDAAIAAHVDEIAAIKGSADPATFDNTVAALDYAGQLLGTVSRIFFAKHGADTNEELQKVAAEIAPKLSAHRDAILMDAALFARIKAVHNKKAEFGLIAEQLRLIEETYDEFVRGGAELDSKKKARLAEVNQRLAALKVQFQENLLAENNAFKLVIDKKEDLAGLPDSAVTAAAEAATKAGDEGKWIFTLHKPSLIPFLQFAEHREHRQTMLTGYIERGNQGNEQDNKAVIVEMVKLRIEAANLLGFPTHAHYVLADNMAGTPGKVNELLDRLWKAALPMTVAERTALQAMIDKEKGGFKLESWDWWYYTEKLRKEKYDLSDQELRPYFELKNVQRGAFEVATKLFGLLFIEKDDMPVYHPDVKVVEVQEADGTHVGLLYLDYHPRKSKQQGAWMTGYRGQHIRDGKHVAPVVANVFNFSKATGDKPALISFEEVTTLFHEFGHGLHGLLSRVTYPGLAGTNVSRDFVELPSQFMENWAVERSVLKAYARHYETNEPIPDELIEKIIKARHFNQGFATTEYLAASFLDMDWHTLDKDPGQVDVLKFEKAALDELGLIPEIVSRYRSTFFAHIFAGGYSSGYYSYIWAAVLDADAFAAFKEKEELFDPETAKSLRENILSKGNTEDPMELFKRFRGREPSIDPLLERRGLK